MVQYRRNRVAGGCYFFTVTLQDRRQRYLVEHVAWLREAFRVTMRRRPFVIDAIVVLPDHLHCIWTLPPGDDDYPARWQAIKAHFVKRLHRMGIRGKAGPDGAAGIWQRRYWEHTLRDEADFAHHVAYIHHNPVKQVGWAKAMTVPFNITTILPVGRRTFFPYSKFGLAISVNIRDRMSLDTWHFNE